MSRSNDRVDNTLRRLTTRGSTRELSRRDVDDMFWAIRQLNERNAVVRDVLSRTDDSILSEKDIERMEATLDAVRNLYRWVADTNEVQQQQRGVGVDEPEQDASTLRAIARMYGVTTRALRETNPHLDHLGSAEPLPPNTRVSIPKNRNRGGDSGVRTLKSISKRSGVPIRVLRDHNPDADDFGEDEELPRDLPINVPVEDGGDDQPPPPPRAASRGRSQSRPRGGSRSTAAGGGAPFVTTGKESIRTIAEDIMGVDAHVLREWNPQLDEFTEDERLPRGTRIAVRDPGRDVVPSAAYDDDSAESRAPVGRGQRRSSMSPHRRLTSRDAPDYVTSGRETMEDVARGLGVHVQALLASNEHLRNYNSYRPLPPGTEVFAPM